MCGWHVQRTSVEPRIHLFQVTFLTLFPDAWLFVCCPGWLLVPQTASYAFRLGSDDGSLLYIDGQLLIDNSGAFKRAVLRALFGAEPKSLAASSCPLSTWLKNCSGRNLISCQRGGFPARASLKLMSLCCYRCRHPRCSVEDRSDILGSRLSQHPGPVHAGRFQSAVGLAWPTNDSVAYLYANNDVTSCYLYVMLED